ncbi:uncharacterized protein LOC111914589 [Lactuca sativa]|uniref:uncharacterized protein LOC111914589 n=1 Tax=Lactuca sativa TaxID=4236 RepID=UPI000CB48C1D|nr:uncharacterized protein LOC111914589 [Lactuca sativa]
MRLLYICSKEATEIGRQVASGACPYCKGKVEAVDTEHKWMFCCIPISYVNKRKYVCSLCSRRLVLYDQ